MIKNPKNLILFAVIGGVFGIGLGLKIGRLSAPKSVAVSISDAKAEMTTVLIAQQEAWNAGDIDGYMQGYLQSDKLRFASGGDITLGWHKTLNRYKMRYSDGAKMGRLRFDIESVDVFDEFNGQIFGKWTLFRDADKPSGLFTLHMKKGRDGWKVVSDHTSSASN